MKIIIGQNIYIASLPLSIMWNVKWVTVIIHWLQKLFAKLVLNEI